MTPETTADEADIDVRAWREERGLTQTQLSDLLPVSHRTLQRWERTLNHTNPPAFLARALADLDRELRRARADDPTPPADPAERDSGSGTIGVGMTDFAGEKTGRGRFPKVSELIEIGESAGRDSGSGSMGVGKPEILGSEFAEKLGRDQPILIRRQSVAGNFEAERDTYPSGLGEVNFKNEVSLPKRDSGCGSISSNSEEVAELKYEADEE